MSNHEQGRSIRRVKVIMRWLGVGWVCSCVLACSTLQAEQPGKLSLSSGDRVVMTYNADLMPSPDPAAPWFQRSGFIHPFHTPSGRVVTEAFPADHLHQHGLMFAWTNSVYDGRPVDFWNSKLQAGHIEHVQTIRADDDRIEVRLQHVDDTSGKPIIVLDESWELTRVRHESMNVVDLVSKQHCVAPLPLQIRQYHYGAMCVRGAKAWLDEPCTMVTNEGKDRAAGNHSRPNWVMMHGTVDDQPCGLVAMGHPDNFRGPQPVRLHPRKPYFCFAPMVLGDFSIEPGTPYVSRFRFVAFDGTPDERELNAMWDDFSKSVQVRGDNQR